VSGTNYQHGSDGHRRGLFRRGSRDEVGGTAVATVDDLVRRMDELVADGPSFPHEQDRHQIDFQGRMIARANDRAAITTVEHANVPMPETTTYVPTAPTAPEATVQHQQTTQDSDAVVDIDEIEARLDAALQQVQLQAASTGTVTLDPTPAPAAPRPDSQDAVLAPTSALTSPEPSSPATYEPQAHAHETRGEGAAARMGIDVDRLVHMIEDEAEGVQRRIELELNHAHAQAEDILDRAEHEAERIREHGQSQARVLLGEVEEIISEAQQTGEQILLRANEEAAAMRADATGVMQQAQTEARSIIDTARRDGEQVLAEQRRLATVRAQEAMREQERLKDQIRRLEERRRQVLESLEPLITQLTQMIPAAGQQQAAARQNVVDLQPKQPKQQPNPAQPR
jgi:F0F1-type ATP synthase membrane subunit b/b'